MKKPPTIKEVFDAIGPPYRRGSVVAAHPWKDVIVEMYQHGYSGLQIYRVLELKGAVHGVTVAALNGYFKNCGLKRG